MPVKIAPFRMGEGSPVIQSGQADGIYRAAVYTSATSWGKRIADCKAELAYQSGLCGAYLRAHRDIKRTGTYSDKNTSRDVHREWNRLLEDVECGKADTVLVTSLGYVAETFGMAEYYVGRFFYPGGIRFIAVEDGFDSRYDDMEAYLRRFLKIAASRYARKWREERIKGGHICRDEVPYGYIYKKGEPPEIRIDMETAPYVRQLFEMAEDGAKIVEMARFMNGQGAPTPRQRRARLYGQSGEDTRVWKNTMIKGILRNPCYTGDYKDIPGHHAPIVSRALYEKAGEVLEKKKFQNAKGVYRENPFRGRIFCACCGAAMEFHMGNLQEGPGDTYQCNAKRYQGAMGCLGFSVQVSAVHKKVCAFLQDEIELAERFGRRLETLYGEQWYQQTVLDFEERESACKEQIRHSDGNTEVTEKLLSQLETCRREKGAFMSLFSLENPWYRLFGSLKASDTETWDGKSLKRYIKRIDVAAAGDVAVSLAEESWKKKLEPYNSELVEKGLRGLWER